MSRHSSSLAERQEEMKSRSAKLRLTPDLVELALAGKLRYPEHADWYRTVYRIDGILCDICGSQKRLGVDHNHATGFIRGLLCGRCNSAIGLLRENEQALKQAILYLRANQENIKQLLDEPELEVTIQLKRA